MDEYEVTLGDTFMNMEKRLHEHDRICVSVSGGSDSNVIAHMIATKFRQYLPKIHFVFSDTGLEYRATLKHLDYMEKQYDIHIDRIKGTPIPLAVKRYGVPFLSKNISEFVERLQYHDFEWESGELEALTEKYGKCKAALKWWANEWGEGSRFNIERRKGLREFLMVNKKALPSISVKCCKLSKKGPLLKYEKAINADLIITGERKCEGGARATAHSGCFGKLHGTDRYMPLWWWSDAVKRCYKEEEGVVYSDCYEVYGMKRTGCVGCPFALKRKEELKIMMKYEPNLYRACISVFGEAYKLTDDFEKYKRRKFDPQLNIFDMEERKND